MGLKRSVINAAIQEARDAFARFGLALPPWAHWPAARWQEAGHEYDEVRDCMLGWDVTDFGSGRFAEIGRTLFTLRNGSTRTPGYAKAYAQKYLFDPEAQRAPAHFHQSKMEDICCLAGGNIMVQLRSANPDGTPSVQPLRVQMDGIARTVAAGETIRLRPGMSLCIVPRTIHQFWGEEGWGPSVSAEVSSVCDDWRDNCFLQPAERFPEIIEDEPAQWCLCGQYPAAR
jgi:D-lyxose ketol-isomerase